MNKPVRIQRKRTKGWRMPENTVYVGRPNTWANPFRVGHDSGIFDGKDGRILGFRDQVEILMPNLTSEQAVDLYKAWMNGITSPEMYPHGHRAFRPSIKMAKIYLRDKNLACWCPLDQPCHADVLLELANA